MIPDRRGALPAGLALGIVLAVAAVTAATAAVVAVKRESKRVDAGTLGSGTPVPALAPIASEAEVFRTPVAMLAIGDPATPRRNANPRTLHTYRIRRAYPGAPPRIPHGLTSEEFRTNTCNNCHQRGGYSPRFGAYVPVTPHPELEACLQCHLGDDEVTGVVLPSHDPSTICRQCHDPDALQMAAARAWPSSAWPRLSRSVPGDPPPPIPHDLELRGNCVTCHAGPGAVAELRTDHPERANCRQCHVTQDAESGTFSRPSPSAEPPAGERP